MKSWGPSSADSGQPPRFSSAVARRISQVEREAQECLGGAFDAWLRLGGDLTSLPSPARERAALAYFNIPPARVAAVGVEALQRWVAAARDLAAASSSLAATFCEATAPVLGSVGATAAEAWAREGLRLYRAAGGTAGPLAHAFLAAGHRCLRLLAPPEYPLLARLGPALRSVMKADDIYRSLPLQVGRWSATERSVFLDCCAYLAEREAKAAATFYLHVPEATDTLSAPLRELLLQICRRAATAAPATFAPLVPIVAALVLAIPPTMRLPALELAADVASRFPSGAPALLASLPRLCEEADSDHLRAWAERGLTIAADNPAAGLAYFALQSRTSLKVLRGSPTIVTLEEVEGVLRKFILMLSGERTLARPAGGFRLRPPLEEEPRAEAVSLPASISCLATHEENARLYRVVAGLLAGRREFGTYVLAGEADGCGTGLVKVLRSPSRPEVIEDLFLLADGYRVACRLADSYPGLASDLRWAAGRLLALWSCVEAPHRRLLLDAVLALSLLGPQERGREWPWWLKAAGRIILPHLSSLASAQATARDALAVAELLASLFSRLRAQVAASAQPERASVNTSASEADQLPGSRRAQGAREESRTASPGRESAPAEAPAELRISLGQEAEGNPGGGDALSTEELMRLLEALEEIPIRQVRSERETGGGLPITHLAGKLPLEGSGAVKQHGGPERGAWRPRGSGEEASGAFFLYDEWDYLIDDYRQGWCRLWEITPEGDPGSFFARALAEHATLVPEIRRQFQRVRPEGYRVCRGLEDGDDIDINAVVTARGDARAKRPPSPKLYLARTQRERDVATLFLLDMSASTDEPAAGPDGTPKRIIDVAKEALVIVAAALEEIGDAYAIYGFSGYGRHAVDFYVIKSFAERLTPAVKGRLGAIRPKRSTRMGAALRHARSKLAELPVLAKHLFLLSDGFPQDFDYGEDRTSHTYGLRDTAMALREVGAAGIQPFCITVDRAGHDYLREMCDSSRYLVIDQVSALPRELPKIYRRVVRAA